MRNLIIPLRLKVVCRFCDTTAPTKEGLLWDDKIVSNLHEQTGYRNQPKPPVWSAAFRMPPIFVRSHCYFKVTSMADQVVPHFHNDAGVAVIEIGAHEFMCIGAKPPFDHPHVYCDMGDDREYVCPYCSTLYRHNPELAPNAARPEECALTDAVLVDLFLTSAQTRLLLGEAGEILRMPLFIAISVSIGWGLRRLSVQRNELDRQELRQELMLADAERRLAEELEIGHATSPVAGDGPDLQGVDRGVKEDAGESRGQAIEDIGNEIQVVLDVASPRHDPAVIEDRLTPVLPLAASPSKPFAPRPVA